MKIGLTANELVKAIFLGYGIFHKPSRTGYSKCGEHLVEFSQDDHNDYHFVVEIKEPLDHSNDWAIGEPWRGRP